MRKLAQDCPDCLVRAFADDTAMVIPDFFNSGPRVISIFHNYETFSGLKLNLAKTIVIPLWKFDVASLKQHVTIRMPDWAPADFRDSGKYLGFWIGPGKSLKSWEAPIKKYISRASVWVNPKLGFLQNCCIYRTFVFSVLSFIWQLEEVPSKLLQEETRILRTFTPGPGNWVSKRDLFLRL